ncbi:hypothetical protein BaRGS_00019118 [Batillaria attramentaria]|uniref:Uncharacterized protein n=1 Tax=Batillaria attramentaria TaxID=370345 RepID=A0ABD0KS84_9CAEN
MANRDGEKVLERLLLELLAGEVKYVDLEYVNICVRLVREASINCQSDKDIPNRAITGLIAPHNARLLAVAGLFGAVQFSGWPAHGQPVHATSVDSPFHAACRVTLTGLFWRCARAARSVHSVSVSIVLVIIRACFQPG